MMHDVQGSGDRSLSLVVDESARTGMQVAGLRLATYLAGFMASVVIARTLGAEGRGRYVLPMTVLAIVVSVGNVGLEHAQIFLRRGGAAFRALWANASVVASLVGISVVVIVGAISIVDPAEGFLGTPDTWWLVAALQTPVLLQVLYWTNILQLAGRLRALTIGVLGSTVAQTALVVLLAAAGTLTPFTVLVVAAIANGITWAACLAVGRRAGVAASGWDRSLLFKGLAFGLRAQVGIVFVFLLFRVDQVLVQGILGFERLGVYSVAVMLAELLWLLSDPLAAALLRHQVEAGGDGDVHLGYAMARLGLTMLSLVAIVAWIVAPWAIRLAYGEAFMGSVWAFRLLLPGVVLLAVQRPLAAVLLARGRPMMVSAYGAGALTLNVVVDLLLLDRIGIAGAAIASTLSYLLLAIAYVAATRRIGGISLREDLIPRVEDARRLSAAFKASVRRQVA